MEPPSDDVEEELPRKKFKNTQPQENKESPSTANPSLAQNPYASFLAEQRQSEIKWATDREAKRTREELNEHVVEIHSLKEQLQAKNRECDLLKNQLEKTNAVVTENH